MRRFASLGVVVTVGAFASITNLSCRQDPAFIEQQRTAELPVGSDDAVAPGKPDDTTIDPLPVTTMSYLYDADVLAHGSMSQSLAEPWSHYEVTLMRDYHAETRAFRQKQRPQQIDTFHQNPLGQPEVEVMQPSADRKVDILVVVDNSSSMREEHVNLSTKLAPLVSSLQKADWQIGVISTDTKVDQGCLRALVRKGDVNAMATFEKAVMDTGTAGDGEEKGILASVQGLTGQCKAQLKPWVRAGSTVSVLVVSDEDNCHTGDGNDTVYGCRNLEHRYGDYLLNYIKSIRTPGKDGRVYGIVWHPTQPQSSCRTGLRVGIEYQKVIEATSGRWGSICDADYSATLAGISTDILVALQKSFTLRYTPDPGTLRVALNGEDLQSGYALQGQLVDFDVPPAEGSQIRFSYNVGGMPLKTGFQLADVARPDELRVEVDGAVVASTTYTYDPARRLVEFAFAPPPGAEIKATYLREVALDTVFVVGKKVRSGSMKVSVGGIPAEGLTVNEETGSVTFSTAPSEGAEINVAYVAYGGPVLGYPFVVTVNDPEKLSAFDRDTNVPVAVSYASRRVDFAVDDWVEGRVIRVRFYNEARSLTKARLPAPVVPASVVAVAGGVVCSASDVKIGRAHV